MKKDLFTRDELNNMDAEALKALVLSQQVELKNMRLINDDLTEQLTLMRAKTFGRKSEKDAPNQVQLTIFNESEALVDQSPAAEPEIEQVIASYTRKKRTKGQQAQDLSELPVEVIKHTLPEAVLEEKLGKDYKRFPDSVYRKVAFMPAQLIVKEHHIAVYRSKKGDKILRADHPVELMTNSIVTPSLAAGVINAKYVNHLPLNRIEASFKQHHCLIRKQVMAGWMIKLTERYLVLVYDRLKKALLQQMALHVDETPLMVRKDGRKAGAKSYMWVYRSLEAAPEQVVLYDYCKTRAGDQIAGYLKGYRGVIVSDGYQAYHALANDRPEEIKVAGCWVHALRKFKDSVRACGDSDKKRPKYLLASQGIAQIQQIIRKDNALKALSCQARLEKRQTEIRPLVAAFFAWAKLHREDVTRGSNTGKAFTYALNQEPYLMTFLDVDVPHENNAAERAIRPFTVGRKNWQIIDTMSGAGASAVLYSLVETAKANQLRPYDYFKHLLEEIPKHMDDHDFNFLEDLMPWSDKLPESCLMKE